MKPEAVMAWMIVVDCSWFQVLTDPRLDKEEISTDGATEAIWPLLRPAVALPRLSNVSVVMVWMLNQESTSDLLLLLSAKGQTQGRIPVFTSSGAPEEAQQVVLDGGAEADVQPVEPGGLQLAVQHHHVHLGGRVGEVAVDAHGSAPWPVGGATAAAALRRDGHPLHLKARKTGTTLKNFQTGEESIKRQRFLGQSDAKLGRLGSFFDERRDRYERGGKGGGLKRSFSRGSFFFPVVISIPLKTDDGSRYLRRPDNTSRLAERSLTDTKGAAGFLIDLGRV
ncbi:hypothetical protein EYF80_019778 [Liparis tanakae]|uniref:Uncharacterized protein n=1 Tax=Liparis tanakae TaxID=230148 RepID=A0A4Z2HX45_9TELE|nr:hypothetical protein EYF80_019778 [Liparis tanakae]